MLKSSIIVTLTALMTLASTSTAAPAYKLTPAWTTEATLDTPECVLYNPVDQWLYVSNVAGPPAEKNGKGFISRISTDGKIINLHWATGLHAPKGMTIYDHSLFVTDIDELIEIDLSSGTIKNRYPAAEAKFLNDAEAGPDGKIYVSDSSGENGQLYRLSNGKLKTWIKSAELGNPNGLLLFDGKLIAGHAGNGQLNAIDLESKELTPVAKTDSGIDGLKPDGKGNWFTSNWKGRTTLVTANNKTIVLMDTTGTDVNSADFEYLPEKKLLIIPTFFGNTVAAYTVE